MDCAEPGTVVYTRSHYLNLSLRARFATIHLLNSGLINHHNAISPTIFLPALTITNKKQLFCDKIGYKKNGRQSDKISNLRKSEGNDMEKKSSVRKKLVNNRMTSVVAVPNTVKRRRKVNKMISPVITHEPQTSSTVVDERPDNNPGYMDNEQKQFFRELLLKWRDELIEQAEHTVDDIRYDTANYPDDTDRASREERFGLELRTRNREQKLIEKIEHTIDQIDQGKYGFCEECGVSIGLERLKARPTATYCIDCKLRSEMREKQGIRDR